MQIGSGLVERIAKQEIDRVDDVAVIAVQVATGRTQANKLFEIAQIDVSIVEILDRATKDDRCPFEHLGTDRGSLDDCSGRSVADSEATVGAGRDGHHRTQRQEQQEQATGLHDFLTSREVESSKAGQDPTDRVADCSPQ